MSHIAASIAKKMQKISSPSGKKDSAKEDSNQEQLIDAINTSSRIDKSTKMRGVRQNKSLATASQSSETKDPMECAKCKQNGNPNFAECEIFDLWFCPKCTNLNPDAIKLLESCKAVHWYCQGCEKKAVGAVTNMKYTLGKKSPDDFLNHRIINKMDEAFNLLEEKMQKAAQAVEVTMKQS